MIKVTLPKDRAALERQVKALKILLEQDTREKDRQIHRQALEDTERALQGMEG